MRDSHSKLPARSHHRILSKMLFESWFIIPSVHAAMWQQLRARLNAKDYEIDPVVESESSGAPRPPDPEVGNGVAIISVAGIIGKRLSMLEMMCGGCDLEYVTEQIEEAGDDADIHSIILDFNSPGGLYTGLPEAAKLIADVATTKTVISFTDIACCSAAYWLASQANEFYCTHSAAVGSIGGFVAAADTSGEWAKEGIVLELFRSGDLKAIGLDGKKWEQNERDFVQTRVDKQCAEFRADVQRGRGQLKTEVMQGQSFDGDQAVAAGLVDRLVTDIQEVVDIALAAHYGAALSLV
jgi:signal peptide peptidase SppA